MENRVFVTARSRVGALDVAAALAAVGGGGHAAAASAIVKDRLAGRAQPAASPRPAARAVAAVPTAADVMSTGLHWVAATTTRRRRGLALCERHGFGGLVGPRRRARSSGTVARRDLDRAVRHGLGHAPVKAVMMLGHDGASAPTPRSTHAARLIAASPLGWVPVVGRPATASGSLRRRRRRRGRDALRRCRRAARRCRRTRPRPAGNIAGRLAELGLDDLLEHIQAVATGYRGVYLVGGAVRDLLLGERHVDLDIAVEGDGIEFARELARRLGGHVRPHEKFQTAVVVVRRRTEARLRVDVASTRTEFYDYPAALPKVEHATIRSDLARRDFTINAMAVSLRPRDVRPPARLLRRSRRSRGAAHRRAAQPQLHRGPDADLPRRSATRTATACAWTRTRSPSPAPAARMDLIGDLSSARLRDELVLLLDEDKVDFTLRRLEELGLAASIHGRPRAGAAERTLIAAADALRARHRLEARGPRVAAAAGHALAAISTPRRSPPGRGACASSRARRRRARTRGVVARAPRDRLARGPSEAELYDLAARSAARGAAPRRWLDDDGHRRRPTRRASSTSSRHVRLEIGGDDLLADGLGASADLGDVLRNVLRLKLNGVVAGRDEELAAARLQQAAR